MTFSQNKTFLLKISKPKEYYIKIVFVFKFEMMFNDLNSYISD